MNVYVYLQEYIDNSERHTHSFLITIVRRCPERKRKILFNLTLKILFFFGSLMSIVIHHWMCMPRPFCFLSENIVAKVLSKTYAEYLREQKF